MVLFKRGKNDEYIVLLNTNGRYWCRMLSNSPMKSVTFYAVIIKNKRHLWYEEAVCELLLCLL